MTDSSIGAYARSTNNEERVLDHEEIDQGHSGLFVARAGDNGSVDRAIPTQGFGHAAHRRRILTAALVGCDVFCIVSALLISSFIRFNGPPPLFSYVLVLLVGPAVLVAMFYAFSLYHPEDLSTAEEFKRVISAVSVAMILLSTASFWTKSELSRTWVASTWILALALTIPARTLLKSYRARLRADGRLALRTLVVGANGEAQEIDEALRTPGSGYVPVGHIAGRDATIHLDDERMVGTVDRIEEAIRETGAECIFIAPSSVDSDSVLRILQAARRERVDVRVSSGLPEILSTRVTVHAVSDVMALAVKTPRLTGMQVAVKRIVDLGVASLALIVTSPFWVFTALAIKLDSRGPILFRQERVTKGGRTFMMIKFRTMSIDADKMLERAQSDSTVPFFKIESDPRLTRVGRFIRQLSLDELPQLVNVLKGDMSLIGPRPLPAEQVAANLELLGPRHEVPAGVTGWWQVQGRSNVGPEEAVRMDAFYIENWSLSLDMFILLKTAKVLLTRRGAY